MSLLTLGTVAIDNITTDSGVKQGILGGSAAHFSMSARLFTKVELAGVVGEDFPKKFLTLLKNNGVNTESILQEKGKSFQWEGEYVKGDYNSAITKNTELGVLATYEPQVTEKQRAMENVFLANLAPDMQDKFLSLLDRPNFIGLDSMNLWIHTMRAPLVNLMKKVNLFVANDKEAQDLTGEDNLIKAAKKLQSMGPAMVVVKKGEHGVIFYCKEFMFSFPAFPIEKVIDPTGAGDTFAGGLMGYLTKVKKVDEASMRKAVLYATVCASFNVEGFGPAKTQKMTLADVNERLKYFTQFISYR